MSVRLLRAKQRGPKCSTCGERAKWRGVDFTRFACADHEKELRAEDDEQVMRERNQEGDGF
jgi:tRNA(Ile2) C34 agmatinyltransferase TiaS